MLPTALRFLRNFHLLWTLRGADGLALGRVAWAGAVMILLAAGATPAGAAEAISSLRPPTEPVRPGGVVTVEWIAVNPLQAEVEFPAPRQAEAVLRVGDRTLPVSFQSVSGAPGVIPPGGFAHRRYELTLPPELVGLVVLEVDQDGAPPLRAALEVQPDAPETAADPPARLSTLANPEPAASALVRTFAGRLGAHEPIYFIYGGEEPAAKFQFSFKYRLLTFIERRRGIWPETLHFGYTQRSLWDLEGESSPFYDTSYMPELLIESLSPMRDGDPGWFGYLGYQAGLRHESNGRDGPISRSLNQAYLRGIFALGPLDGWHLLLSPELYEYIGDLEDNPQLPDYRGYGRLRMIFGKNDRPSLMVTTWAGRDFDHVSYELDLTIPVKTPLLDFETYLLIQYFNGYGESLLSFDESSETFRAGLSFVR